MDDAAPARPTPRMIAGVCAAIVAVALAGYARTGSPSLAGFGAPADDTRAVAANAAAPGDAAASAPPSPEASVAQIAALVDQLAARMKERPDDAEGWVMLARSYMVLGRPGEAAPAYQRAAALRRDDAGLLADWADALASDHDGRATPEAADLVDRALKIDPANAKALALSGAFAFDRGDFGAAIERWQAIVAALPPDGELAKQVQASIAQARAAASQATRGAAAPAGAAVSGTVTLAKALAAKAAPDDTVFVFARAAGGGRMPLAVLRAKVSDLPLRFTLDDSMAMGPMAKLSSAAQVIVGARVSRSGDPVAKDGDLSGESAPVAPGATGVAVEIGSVVRR